MNKKEIILNQFKTQLKQFLDELIGKFPSESNLILARIFISEQIPIEDVIKYTVEKLLPLKELVQKRDEKFFLENDVLFGGIQSNTVNHFKNLWTSGNLEKDDKETIFSWFDVFLMLSEKYVKVNQVEVSF